MKCPKCDGRGTVGYFHIDHFVDIDCDRCHGSGEVSEVQMTNEEYLKSLNTEQLAETIFHICNLTRDVDTVYRWLKQPHT